jgi:hypothetical protein
MIRVELTREQYGALMRLVRNRALEVMGWESTLEGAKRDPEYQLMVEILQALREGREGE